MDIKSLIIDNFKIIYTDNISSKSNNLLYILDAEPYLFQLFSSVYYHLLAINKDTPHLVIIGISFSPNIDNYQSLSPTQKFNLLKPLRKKYYIKNFLDFSDNLLNNILPLINKKLNIIPNERAILGYSLAGLFINYLKINNPSYFDYILVCSPSFAYLGEDFIKSTHFNKNLEKGFLMSYGEKESYNMKKLCKYFYKVNKENGSNIILIPIKKKDHYNIKVSFVELSLKYICKKWEL